MAFPRTKLRFFRVGSTVRLAVEHPWRSIGMLRQLNRLTDKALSFAELPTGSELPRILEAAEGYKLPSIWRRTSASPLEGNAALLFCALAFSAREQWIPIIHQFLNELGLKVDLRGRPAQHPKQLTDIRRGEQIGRLMRSLARGFQVANRLKRAAGYCSEDDAVAMALQKKSYNAGQVRAILEQRTLQGAACQYHRDNHEPQVQLRSIKNSFARYKQL